MREKVTWVLQYNIAWDSKVKYGSFHRLTQKIDNNHYLIYYQLGKRYFPVDIFICAECNWRVCIAYNKYSEAASMIIYSVQYKGYHIPPSPTPATGKKPVFMASYFSCLRHIGFWTGIINTRLPSSVSDILDLEQLFGDSFLVCRSIWILKGLPHEMDIFVKAYKIKYYVRCWLFKICQ